MMIPLFVTLCLVGLLALFVAVIVGWSRSRNTRRLIQFSLGSLFFLITAISIALAFSRSAFFDNNIALAVIGFPYLLFLLLVIRMAFADVRSQTRGGERHSPLQAFRRRQLDAANDEVAHLDATLRESAEADATAGERLAAPPRRVKWWLKRWENRYHTSNPGVDHGQD